MGRIFIFFPYMHIFTWRIFYPDNFLFHPIYYDQSKRIVDLSGFSIQTVGSSSNEPGWHSLDRYAANDVKSRACSY